MAGLPTDTARPLLETWILQGCPRASAAYIQKVLKYCNVEAVGATLFELLRDLAKHKVPNCNDTQLRKVFAAETRSMEEDDDLDEVVSEAGI